MKKRFNKQQKGITLVEFAIAGFAIFLMIFATIDTSLVISDWNKAQEAGRLAARAASVCSEVQDLEFVISHVKPEGLSIKSVTHSWDGDPSEYMAIVTLSAFTHNTIFPLTAFNFPERTYVHPMESGGLVPDQANYQCQ